MHACSVKSNSLPPQGLTRLLSPWDSPGRNPGVGCCALLQGSSRPRIKLASPALQVDSLPPSHWGKPRDCDAHQIFYFFLDVSQAPCHWGRPSDYSHQKKKKGSCDAGCFPTQAMKSLHGILRFFLACHGHWQCLGSWASCTQVSEWKPGAESLTLTSLNKHMCSLC